MAWRIAKPSDIKRGTVVRITNINDGYNIATIVGVIDSKGVRMGGESLSDYDVKAKNPEVHLVRPFAYAHSSWDDKNGLFGHEQTSITAVQATSGYLEVFEGSNGNVRSMTT